MPPAALLLPPDDHTDWQVVLVDPSTRRVVLHDPRQNRFAVRPGSHPSQRLLEDRESQDTRDNGLEEFRSNGDQRRLGEDSSPLSPADLSPTSSQSVTPPGSTCPLCRQSLSPTSNLHKRHRPTGQPFLPLPPSSTFETPSASAAESDDGSTESSQRKSWRNGRRAGKHGAYFELLSEVNSLANSPSTTAGHTRSLASEGGSAAEAEGLGAGQMNEGYCEKFFEEVQLLGKGGQGTVYLVRHVLNGEGLGLYALKKIAVGNSAPSLLSLLREVHLLESLSHPNIITYHHAWLETSLPSPLRPAVPTLHVLMALANGGSLQSFIAQRAGAAAEASESRKERLKRRREGRERAVHLLRVEDLLELFGDIMRGLAFLHSRNILHLDLKAENVLLHWDEDALLPRCQLSDFGNATDDSYHRERHGGSGTLEYTPPEAWQTEPRTGQLAQPTRSTDMWGLGLILHLLCFFTLPWRSGDDIGALEQEIRNYRGFVPSDALPSLSPTSSRSPPSLSARHDLPPSLLLLLSSLIHLNPSLRPSCERVSQVLPTIRMDATALAAAGGMYASQGGEGAMVRHPPVKQEVVRSRALSSYRQERVRSESSSGDRLIGAAADEAESEVEERERWQLLPPVCPPALMPSSFPALIENRLIGSATISALVILCAT
ncbi:hypothetical protein JCM11641_004893 [Rhodosporidiobolus odoratus]